MYGRRKYAEFRGLSLKCYEMNIQPISWLKTQIQFETFAKKWKKNSDMNWELHIKMHYAQNLRKCLNEAKKTIFRMFPNSERNLVMHFHKTVYTDIFHNFIRFHWVSEIYIPKCFYCIHFALESSKSPNFTYILLTINNSNLFWTGL